MSWTPVKLGEICTLNYGKSLQNYSDHLPEEGSARVFGTNGPIGWTKEPLTKEPTIIVGRKGAYRGVHISSGPSWTIDTAYFTSTDPSVVDLQWFFYRLRLLDINSMNSGAAIPSTRREDFYAATINLPDLPTQQRIAGVLSAYDDLIENSRRRIGLLEQAARLLYREWFVHCRFPDHETATIVDGLPEGWSTQLLADLCVEGGGIQTGPFGSQLHQSDYTDIGVPVVMPKDMKDNKVDCDGIARIPESLADKLGRHRMLPGDTVYGRRGDIGRRAFIGKRQTGFFCGTGCLRIRPDPEKINARYLFETLGSPATSGFIANQAKGSTMPNLSAGALKKVPVLCAPDALQVQFTNIIEPMLETAEILDDQITRLTRARDLLVPRLMDGRIPV